MDEGRSRRSRGLVSVAGKSTALVLNIPNNNKIK